MSSSSTSSNTPESLKNTTLSLRKVCELFGVHEKTLRRWMKEGVPTPDGGRIRLRYIPVGARKTLFRKEEVQRVIEALETSANEEAEIIPFDGGGLCRRCRRILDGEEMSRRAS